MDDLLPDRVQQPPRPPLGLLPETRRARVTGVSSAQYEEVGGHLVSSASSPGPTSPRPRGRCQQAPFVQYRTVHLPFVCMCAIIIPSIPRSTLWLCFFVAVLESGHVFGGRSPSASPCRKSGSLILDVQCLLVKIRLGRETMLFIFFRSLGGPCSGCLGRVGRWIGSSWL